LVLGTTISTQKRRIKMSKIVKDIIIFTMIIGGFFYGLSVINYHASLLEEVERVTGKYSDMYYDKPNLVTYDEEAYEKDMKEHKQKLLQKKVDSLFKNGEYKVPKGL
jgi:hypothetical protein